MPEDAKKDHWNRPALKFGLFVLVLLGSALPAAAQTVVLFGPQEFVRGEGKPVTARATFQVPPAVNNCRIEIDSDAAGSLTANNLSVQVNGAEMADDHALMKGSQAPAEVELLSLNTLLVTLKGKPGDSVIVKITGEEMVEGPPAFPLAPPDEPIGPMGSQQ